MSQLWPMLDKDEDGKITKQELSWLQGSDVTSKETDEAFAKVDHDSDGLIDKQEAMAFFTMIVNDAHEKTPARPKGQRRGRGRKRASAAWEEAHPFDEDLDDDLPEHYEL